ncbi:MAG: choice-of-anchor B family protein [Bacteroidota bacterium]
MQKQLLSILFLSFLTTCVFGQLNMSLRSQLQYDTDANDVWGYVAPDDSEYAIVGLRNGVSIVNVTDPDNATQVAFVPGDNSTWRDIKTYGEYAYVVTDQNTSDEGLTVIDLRNLPVSVDFFHWTPEIEGLGQLRRCHNIYIDEFGYAYLAGCNINSGGMLFIDVFTTPGVPAYDGRGPSIYAHDVYTRDNLMYSSEINAGRMAIYDVSDKDNVVELGVRNTPFRFTHNIWLSDDGNVAFTTDERGNAPVAAYDVSNPMDIIELDQYRPTATLGTDVIPHNVHVWNDYLIISYYTDGGIIVDAARPDNLVEVGNFDTFFGNGQGFQGVWGAYPFLPSGIVLLSDIGDGLYVLEPNYVRAAYLEGLVTDAETGAQISGAEIIIQSTEEENVNFSRLDGTYGTGLAISGTYEVQFSKAGYEVLTTEATIENGEVTELDVQLIPLPRYSRGALIVEAEDGEPVEDGEIFLSDGFTDFFFQSNAIGEVVVDNVYEGTFEIYAGKWGYHTQLVGVIDIEDNSDLGVIELVRGYKDDFVTDQGWTTSADGSTRAGFWERAEPNGTFRNGSLVNPEFDIEGDLGDQCYVTGNFGFSSSDNDVDGGSVTLTSPVMELASTYIEPVLTYSAWFVNIGGNLDDALDVFVSNGIERVQVAELDNPAAAWRDPVEITLSNFIEITDEMQVEFVTSDFDPNGDLVEAGVDGFEILGEIIVDINEPVLQVDWNVAPNPFSSDFRLNYQLPSWEGSGQLTVLNALGQIVEQRQLKAEAASFDLGAAWPNGIYFIQMEVPGEGVATQRVVKQ